MIQTLPPHPSTKRQALGLVLWLVLSFSAALTGFVVSVDGWYTQLNKPSWNPPNWLFGPAWTTLYVLMAVAAWLVWREGGWRANERALGLFLVQWMLNALWTPLFFGVHLLALSFVEIVVFWVVLASTLTAFWRTKRVAGALLIPYLAWVTLAAALNFAVWRMNS